MLTSECARDLTQRPDTPPFFRVGGVSLVVPARTHQSSSGKPALKNNLSLFLFFGGGRRNVDYVLFQFLKLFYACIRVFLISSRAAFGNLHFLQIFFFFN